MNHLSLVAVIEGGIVQTVLLNKDVKLDIMVIDKDTDGCDSADVKCIPQGKFDTTALVYHPQLELNPERVKELEGIAEDPVTLLEVDAVAQALGREHDLSNDFIAFVRKARKQAEKDMEDLEAAIARLESAGRGVEIAEEIDLCKAAIALKIIDLE